MSDPHQSWNGPGSQPGPSPYGPHQPAPHQPGPHQAGPQPPWGPHPGPAPWGAPAARPGGGSTALLVLGLVTAVLLALGTVLPSVTLPDGNGSYGPLLQELGGSTYFLAGGLALLVAAGLLVAGALVQRSRARVGTGLLLGGGGMAAEVGLGQMVGRLQVLVDGFGAATSTAVGGVLLMLAGASAVALVVVGLVRLSRLARAS